MVPLIRAKLDVPSDPSYLFSQAPPSWNILKWQNLAKLGRRGCGGTVTPVSLKTTDLWDSHWFTFRFLVLCCIGLLLYCSLFYCWKRGATTFPHGFPEHHKSTPPPHFTGWSLFMSLLGILWYHILLKKTKQSKQDTALAVMQCCWREPKDSLSLSHPHQFNFTKQYVHLTRTVDYIKATPTLLACPPCLVPNIFYSHFS